MTTKITVTLARDEEYGTWQGMFESMARLFSLDIFPLEKISLGIECADQDAAYYRDEIAVALTERPAGIEVKIKRQIEEEIERRKMVKKEQLAPVAPMDSLWRPVPQAQPDAFEQSFEGVPFVGEIEPPLEREEEQVEDAEEQLA